MSSELPGLLFIVSAPSGTGKTTLVERLVQVVPRLRMSRSYTSRPARAGEQDGVDYNFISRVRFEAMIAEHAFLEWADVFGNYYGTSAGDTEAVLAAGEDVVLVIDVHGARQVRGRSKDTEEQILRRLDVARTEVGEFAQYEYVVVNDDLDGAVNRMRAIVMAERARMKSMRGEAEAIIDTFQRRPVS